MSLQSNLINNEIDENGVVVTGSLNLAHFKPDNTYFLVFNYSLYHLRKKRTFEQFIFKGGRIDRKFACRNFILKYNGENARELQFRVYFRFFVQGKNGRGTAAIPRGILSFEGESKPKLLTPMRKLCGTDKKNTTNFGMDENGFRHLIAYCRSVFGHDFKLFGNSNVLFYQSPVMYRTPPDYVWHIFELVSFGQEILQEIREYAQSSPDFFTKYIDSADKKLIA